MYQTLQNWLGKAVFDDPIERELSPLFQIILLLLVAFLIAAVILVIIIFGAETLTLNTLSAVLVLALAFLSALFILRRGYFSAALWVLIAILVVNQARGLSVEGLQTYSLSLFSFVIPITIAGLLMSRLALIIITAVIFAAIPIILAFGSTTALPPPYRPIDQILISFYFVMSFYIVMIGAFGNTFRRVLRASVQRASDLEKTHQELKKHSSQLAELSERLEVTLTSIGDAVIATDAQGRVTFVNNVAQALTGWTQEAATGQPLTTIFRIVNEETRHPVENPVDKVVRLGTVVGLANHTILIAKDGREIPIDDSGAPIRDSAGDITGVVLVFRDISERKVAERRTELLQKVTAALSGAVTPEQVASVILETGYRDIGIDSGLVGLLNEDRSALVSLMHYGYSPAAIERSRQFSIDAREVPVVDAVRTKRPVWIDSAEEYKAQYPELAAISKSMNQTESFVCLPLTVERRVIGAINLSFRTRRHFEEEDRAFILAIAQQAAQALERARLYSIEQRARIEAEEANRLKLQFLAMISHELRTPLTSIKGFATTLLADDITWDTDSQTEFIRIIDQESDKLTELVEQLLDLSRLHVGALSISPQPELPDDIIKRATFELESLSKNHRLTIDVPANLPRVFADVQRINQVLTNLVNNAVKYSPQDTPIAVIVHSTEGFIQFDIVDAGMGIPAEMRELVFEAFRQVERKGEGQIKGAGLGLAICKGIVEAHGGRIWIQDLPSPGTTISFILPIV